MHKGATVVPRTTVNLGKNHLIALTDVLGQSVVSGRAMGPFEFP